MKHKHNFKMDVELCETTLTGQKLWRLLEKADKLPINGSKLEDVNGEIIGVGQGYTSKILRVNLKWSESSGELPKSVIVKIIHSDALTQLFSHGDIDHLIKLLFEAHNTECKIYNLDGLDENVPMPKCYAQVPSADDELGIIVLEDLSDRGLALPLTIWGNGLTPGQLDGVLEACASLHAWSVHNTSWLKTIPAVSEFFVKPLLENFLGFFPQSKAAFPELFDKLDEERLRSYVNLETYIELFGGDPKRRYNLPLVLVQGDVHMMNMMFERKIANEASDNLLALIDWQGAHPGCCMEDLTRILIICVSTDVRRHKGEEILKRYVELFNSKVNNRENRVTYENVKLAYNEMFPLYSIMWTAAMAMFDQMTDKLPLPDETIRKEFKDRVFECNRDLYNDCINMLNL